MFARVHCNYRKHLPRLGSIGGENRCQMQMYAVASHDVEYPYLVPMKRVKRVETSPLGKQPLHLAEPALHLIDVGDQAGTLDLEHAEESAIRTVR